MFVRAERLKALRELDDNIKFYYKVNDDFYFNLENEVYESCLNNVLLNDVIEFMLKLSVKQQADDINTGMTRTQIDKIIRINEKWRGASDMTDIDRARATGFYVSQQFLKDKNENKLNSYKQKLISAIVAHDYSRMNEILLSLSSYINQELGFAYVLFENPEENIGLAYAFANSLSPKPADPNKDNNKGE